MVARQVARHFERTACRRAEEYQRYAEVREAQCSRNDAEMTGNNLPQAFFYSLIIIY